MPQDQVVSSVGGLWGGDGFQGSLLLYVRPLGLILWCTQDAAQEVAASRVGAQYPYVKPRCRMSLAQPAITRRTNML